MIKSCRKTLLALLCGVLHWINEDTLSLLAFSYEISDVLPQYNKFCDGCRCDINTSTDCFSCKSCRNVDLCRLYFARYELDELKDIMSTCQDHSFLDFSKTSSTEIFSSRFKGIHTYSRTMAAGAVKRFEIEADIPRKEISKHFCNFNRLAA